MPNRKKKIAAVLALTVVLVGAGGGAYAYWTATAGTGTGSATTTATTAALTTNQTTVVTSMQPGDAAQVVSGTFNNTNSGSVYVTSVTLSVGVVTKSGSAVAGTCDATDYTVANATMTVAADVVSGNAKGAWTGASIKFNNKAGVNQDACKGATVALVYSIV